MYVNCIFLGWFSMDFESFFTSQEFDIVLITPNKCLLICLLIGHKYSKDVSLYIQLLEQLLPVARVILTPRANLTT